MTRFPTLAPLALVALIAGCDSATYPSSGTEFLAARNGPIDPTVAAIAATNPDLRFPARIGIARLVNNDITAPSQAEAEVFRAFEDRAAGFGTFELVDPMIALTLPAPAPRYGIRGAQLAAARQHLDYVLIYQLAVSGGRGTAQAALMDVRTGYVYGTARSETAGVGRTRTGWGEFAPTDRSAQRMAQDLIPEVVQMFNSLAKSQ